MWHISIKEQSVRLSQNQLKEIAYSLLKGYGDDSLGEWQEYKSYTGSTPLFFLKRRLSASEQVLVGDAIDIRGTLEHVHRWNEVSQYIPEEYRHLME